MKNKQTVKFTEDEAWELASVIVKEVDYDAWKEAFDQDPGDFVVEYKEMRRSVQKKVNKKLSSMAWTIIL